MSRYGSRVGIEYDGGPLEPGRDLREQLKPLASQRGFVAGEAGDVPSRVVEPRHDAVGDGIGHVRKDDRDRPRLPLEGNGRRGSPCQNDVRWQAYQLPRERSYAIGVSAAPTKVHPQVAAIGPTQVHKCLSERRVATLLLGIVFFALHEHADPSHALALLRACRQRPRCSSAAEKRDEIAPSHETANPGGQLDGLSLPDWKGLVSGREGLSRSRKSLGFSRFGRAGAATWRGDTRRCPYC